MMDKRDERADQKRHQGTGIAVEGNPSPGEE